MELALLVYIIAILPKITNILVVVSVFGGMATAAIWLFYFVEGVLESRLWPTIFTVVFICTTVLAVLIPSERTAYLMVGAYATQKIAEAPKTQQLGADVLKIIESKIKFYAEESAKELEQKLSEETSNK